MAKITIEDQGVVSVFSGEITSINLSHDTWQASSIDGSTRHGRTGNGSVAVSMNFVNGHRDDIADGEASRGDNSKD
jgi:hypothetical protein